MVSAQRTRKPECLCDVNTNASLLVIAHHMVYAEVCGGVLRWELLFGIQSLLKPGKPLIGWNCSTKKKQ